MNLRKLVYDTMHTTGLLSLARRLQRDRIAILMFHSVVDFSQDHAWVPLRDHLSVSRFSWMLDVLGEYYDFISMDEAVSRLEHRAIPERPAIAVTFDDGYANNIDVALPVLEERAVPATIYVATEFIETQDALWADRLDFAIQSVSAESLTISVLGRAFKIRNQDRGVQRADFTELRHAIKSEILSGNQEINAIDIAKQVEEIANASLAEDTHRDMFSAFMTVSDIEDMADHELVSFGCHTRNHAILPGLSIDEQREEIVRSKDDIKKWTGAPCRHFAYPNGNHSDETVEVARSLGLISAVTATPGLNLAKSDLFRLCRHHLPIDRSQFELLAHLANAGSVFSSARNVFRRGV